MASEIKYDSKGNKISATVFFKEWQKLNARLTNLENKLKVFKSVQDGIKEVQAARISN